MINTQQMPHSVEFEQSVIGGFLLLDDSDSKRASVLAVLSDTDFYREDHRLIYRALQSMTARQLPIDLLTVEKHLQQKGQLAEAGGLAYLATLAKDTPSAANILTYANNVKQLSTKRQAIDALNLALGAFLDQSLPNDAVSVDDALKAAIGGLKDVAQSVVIGDKSITMRNAQKQALDLIEQYSHAKNGVTGVDTGFASINGWLGGWQKTDLISVLARSGMGKTIFALSTLIGAGKAGRRCGFLSTEMSASQIAMRYLSSKSGVSVSRMRKGDLDEAEWAMMSHALTNPAKTLADNQIYINDSDRDIKSIERQIRRWVADFGVEFVVLDYVQNVNVFDMRGISGDKVREVAYVSSRMKDLAKELNIPILQLSQVAKDIDDRTNKRPLVGDAAWSGAQIQNDSDVMLSIYRHGYYNKDFVEYGAIVELELLKYRHGELDKGYALFRSNHVDFIDAEDGDAMRYCDAINKPKDAKKADKSVDRRF